ncbi:MAG: hypothetical protein M3Z06_05595, partial [Actinomycetota bacterium]|nr:hypothetical protein [Actinomycetota bacterium]
MGSVQTLLLPAVVTRRFEVAVLVLGVGLLVGFATSRLMARDIGLLEGVPPFQKALYPLGTAFTAYGVAVLIPHGNGLIAVFVAAISLGIRRPDLRGYFERQAAGLVELVKLG